MDISVMPWHESASVPILTLMTLLPLVTMFVILIIDKPRLNIVLAYAGALGVGMLSIYLLLVYDPDNTGIQFAEQIKFLGLSYSVGVDGANLLFIPLTTVLTVLILIYLQGTRYVNDADVLVCILGYEAILVGAFSALNALQFWLWSCLEIAPIVYLTLTTGTGLTRGKAVKLLVQFWSGGLLLTLIGFLLLGFGLENIDESLSFDWLVLAQNEAPFTHETLIFILLMYGFAIRMPLFPFHAWLPLLAEQGGVVTSVIFIVGIKLGVYAVIRFVIPLLPGVAEEWSGLMVALGLVGLFYGITLAFMQNNLRRLLAFLAISQTGVLILGIFSFEVAGVEGSLLLSLAYGLAGAGLVFCSGFIVELTQTAFILRLGGLFDNHIAIGLLFLITLLTTIAMPGTPGFNAAQMLIQGIVEKNGWIIALLIGLGNFLAAALLLWTFQRSFLIKPQRAATIRQHSRTRLQERLVAGIISSLLIITGFYSAPWRALIDTATGTIGTYFDFRNAIYNENPEGEPHHPQPNDNNRPLIDDHGTDGELRHE